MNAMLSIIMLVPRGLKMPLSPVMAQPVALNVARPSTPMTVMLLALQTMLCSVQP